MPAGMVLQSFRGPVNMSNVMHTAQWPVTVNRSRKGSTVFQENNHVQGWRLLEDKHPNGEAS
jgi:hypothetical protein